MDIWKGKFVNRSLLVKHRDHCGDISNHIVYRIEMDNTLGVPVIAVVVRWKTFSGHDGEEISREEVVPEEYLYEMSPTDHADYQRILREDGQKAADRWLGNWLREYTIIEEDS